MNKKLTTILTLTILFVMQVSASAQTSNAEAVAGNYNGDIYVNAAYFKKYMPESGQVVNITANADKQTVNVSFTNITWGVYTYENVSVTKNADDTYSLNGEGNCAMANQHGGGEPKNYASDFTGTIVNGFLKAEFKVPGVMGGTTVVFNPDDFGEVASIKAVEEKNAAADAPAFSLSGAKVSKAYKGIVVRNGKKYIQR